MGVQNDAAGKGAPRPWDRITAIVSLVVAVLALGVSLWNSKVTREHNRLSVRPLLQFSRHLSLEAGLNGLIVVNNGVGPAVVKRSALTYDGKEIGPITSASWHQLDRDAKALAPLGHGLFYAEVFISAGARHGVLTLTRPVESFEEFRSLTNRLKVEICYCSVYEDCWTAGWHYDLKQAAEVISNVTMPACS